MSTQHGFKLLREEEVSELNSIARIYKHVQSGAELLSMSNDDENKVFGVTFRTPVGSSNGIAHIMEHSVLCGSRKYKLKEPFIELVKGSLNTFLNAFTYPDKTCYPVASQNTQDFYNLIDVYLDAVFHPLIPEHTLEQEGWHYELETVDGDLTYKGVVFNEMKGAYSSPDSLMSRYSTESLFPDAHPYGVDSGGDPRVIPELTYNEFKAFHEKYYHPSNARIYFYGDDDIEERLRILDGYLSEFEAIDVSDTAVAELPLVDQPQRFTYPYAVDEGQDEDQVKYYIKVNWLLPIIEKPQTKLALSILSHALSGTVGSPLRKKLIDSGLGEDTLGGGFASYLQQPFFSAGMKGVTAENVDKVEALITETLEELVTNGIARETLEASLNTIEFRMRESNTGSYPRGLMYMLASLDTWLYDGDPLESLRYEAPLEAVKSAFEADDGYFESLISRYILENEHRTTVVLEPDTQLSQKLEEDEKSELAKVKASLSTEEREELIEKAKLLRELQEKPDDPAELAKLPSLTLDDLEPKIRTIPIDVSREQGAEIIYHDLFTNGIVYLSVGMNMRVLPQGLLPYVPLFSYALTEMGTETEDYVQLSQRIGRTTGGIRPSYMISDRHDRDEAVTWLSLRGKSTMDNAEEMLAIMRDVLLTVQLDNQERFRQMVLEEKAGEESGLIPGGHGVALGRVRAAFSEAGWLNEQVGGVEYLFFIRDLLDKVENEWPSVLSKLEEIRRLLINRNNMLCNITLDGDNYAQFRPQLNTFLEEMPAADVAHHIWEQGELPQHEGLTIPAQVNYVAKAFNIYDHGYEHHSSISVITNYLRTGYLWDNIRVKGGAYGAYCSFSSTTGMFAQLSYRDPNLQETLDVYDKMADYLQQLSLSQADVTKSIIGVIGNLDSYRLPDAKGYISLNRYLLGISDDYRQQKRDEVLSTTPEHFKALGEALRPFKENGRVAIVGSAEGLKKANEAADEEWLKITKVL